MYSRKYVLFISLYLLTVAMFSQKTDPKVPSHEWRLNMLNTVSGFPEITYEKIINNESSIGVSAAFAVDSYLDMRYLITPYYRHYFSNIRAAGFFIEANTGFYMAEALSYGFIDDSSFLSIGSVGNKVGFGVGMAIGSKFVSKKNWTANFTLGYGRDFTNVEFVNEAYPRLEISIGKRF